MAMAAILALQAIMAVIFFARSMRDPAENANYMAHGPRWICVEPDTALFRIGDTMTVRFGFECRDVLRGRKIFASLLLQCDSAVHMEPESLEISREGIHATVTHCLDSGPIARGWTIQGFEPGDTAELRVRMRWTRVPVPRTEAGGAGTDSPITMMVAMEKDEEEPTESGCERIMQLQILSAAD